MPKIIKIKTARPSFSYFLQDNFEIEGYRLADAEGTAVIDKAVPEKPGDYKQVGSINGRKIKIQDESLLSYIKKLAIRFEKQPRAKTVTIIKDF